MNGRFLYVHDSERPIKEQGDGISLKEPYEKFRGTKPHALVSKQK